MKRISRLMSVAAAGLVCLAVACNFYQQLASTSTPPTLNSTKPPSPTAKSTTPEMNQRPPSARIVGYFTSWGVNDRGYTVAKIPAGRITHINYAFSAVSAQGECALGDPEADVQRLYSSDESVDQAADTQEGAGSLFHGNFNQFRKLKLQYPDLKVLISIGGWDGSSQFSDAALNDESRQKFASSCIRLYFQDYPGVFDGIDIDWEYPVSGGLKPGRAEDRHNFTLLLAELRKGLDAQGSADGKQYLLSIAAPAGDYASTHFELDQIYPYLDWVNLMTYDIHGTWDTITNFNAPLYNSSSNPIKNDTSVDSSVMAYLKTGLPPQKLNVGVPFYGISWQDVPDTNHGLYQVAAGPATSSIDYLTIKNTSLPASTRYWQEEAKNAWLYNPSTGILIAYDDPESVGIKADYVKEHSLGGIMIWELSQDGGELFAAIYNQLKP